MSQRKLFVYGIDTRSRLCELVDLFEQYGRILRVECPPPRDRYATVMFAFIEYCSSRDADTAVRSLDGAPFYCNPLRVEYARSDSTANTGSQKQQATMMQSQSTARYRRSPSPPLMARSRSPMAPSSRDNQQTFSAPKYTDEDSHSSRYSHSSTAYTKKHWESKDESSIDDLASLSSSSSKEKSSEPIAHVD